MSSLDPLERAIRSLCANLDVDASPGDGELRQSDADALFSALLPMPEALSAVALRTASVACVEPQVSPAFASGVIASLGQTGALSFSGAMETGTDRISCAARCLRAAASCVGGASPTSWTMLLRSYREARLPATASPRQVSNLWLDWAGRIVPRVTASSGAAELSMLSEVLRSLRPPPVDDWYFEGGVNDAGVYVAAMTARASRRMVRDVMSGTMQLDGRTLRWVVRSRDGLPLGRVRTEEIVERVLLADLTNGHYDGRYDRIEYHDGDAHTTWGHDVE